jgi:hypothetical protein
LRIEIAFLGQEVMEIERVSLRVIDKHIVFSICLKGVEPELLIVGSVAKTRAKLSIRAERVV